MHQKTAQLKLKVTQVPYGGGISDDNSGTLRYLQIRYAGYEVLPDNELNGITFGGVGSGTTVEYISGSQQPRRRYRILWWHRRRKIRGSYRQR